MSAIRNRSNSWPHFTKLHKLDDHCLFGRLACASGGRRCNAAVTIPGVRIEPADALLYVVSSVSTVPITGRSLCFFASLSILCLCFKSD